MWIDSHCHVTADRFDGDRQAVLSRAGEADLVQLIAIGSGYGLQHNTLAADLARDTEGVFASAGLHPHDANLFDADTEGALRTWLARDEVVAVGECGLDYHYMNSEREDQRRAFAAQVALARELDLPVSIHVRDDGPTAYDELLAIWCEVGGGQTRGVLHCYTGTLAFAKRALEHDFFVSFSGILTFKRSTELRDVARGLPLERLLVETDAPFLAPEGHRGKRNEPAWVARVGETLAEVLGTSLEETAAITRENTQALFGLDPGATLPARSPEAPAPQEDA